ncbi:MAG TPA: serine/threonine-protein kinase [Planctomycetota bacterium]|nr:serine/threonine-protein kinase [Planctomycetota bacterium]
MSAEDFVHKAGDQIGPWTLQRPVGRGGFSEVWVAWRDNPRLKFSISHGEVALKLLIHPEHRDQLRAEAAALSLVKGQGVVPIYEMDLAGDPPWIALELLHGGNLRARMHAERMSSTTAISIFERILAILARVHREGIVHGDLKPENVLYGERNQLLLADFGLSRRISQRSASLSVSLSLEDVRLAGTLDYMAPEQRSGEKPATRSDVYACGVILYELLTGERPQGVFKMPSEIDRSLPPVVDRLIACSLAQDPRHRFASAGAMLAFLRAGVAGDWQELAKAHARLSTLANTSHAAEAAQTKVLVAAIGIEIGTMAIVTAPVTFPTPEEHLFRFGAGAAMATGIFIASLPFVRPWLERRAATIYALRAQIEEQIKTGQRWKGAVTEGSRYASRSATSPREGGPRVTATAIIVAVVVAFALASSRPYARPAPPPPPLPPVQVTPPPWDLGGLQDEWEVRTALRSSWPAPGQRVHSLVAADSLRVAAYSDGTVRILTPAGHSRGHRVARSVVLPTGVGPIACIAAAAGRVAVAESGRRWVRVITPSKPPYNEIVLGIEPVALALTADRVAAGGIDGTVSIATLGGGPATTAKVLGVEIRRLLIIDDDRVIVVGIDGSIVRTTCKLASPLVIRPASPGLSGPVGVAASGERFAVQNDPRLVTFMDGLGAPQTLVTTYPLGEIALTPDGAYAVSRDESDRVSIQAPGHSIGSHPVDCPPAEHIAAVDGTHFLIARFDGTVEEHEILH